MPSVPHSAARYASECFSCIFMLSPWKKEDRTSGGSTRVAIPAQVECTAGGLTFPTVTNCRLGRKSTRFVEVSPAAVRAGCMHTARGRLCSRLVVRIRGRKRFVWHRRLVAGITQAVSIPHTYASRSMSDPNSFADFMRRIRAGDDQAAAELVR